MIEVEEKRRKEKKETGNRDSTARTNIGRAANTLKAQGMYRTNGHANPEKDYTTSQNDRHFHAKRGLRRLLLEQPSSLQRRYSNPMSTHAYTTLRKMKALGESRGELASNAPGNIFTLYASF